MSSIRLFDSNWNRIICDTNGNFKMSLESDNIENF